MNSVRSTTGRFLRLGVALLVQIALLTASAPVATASCTPPRAPHDSVARYVATTLAVASLTGIKADILEYSPYYTGYNPAGSNASILLTNSTHSRWAQLGWLKSEFDGGTITRRMFAEF